MTNPDTKFGMRRPPDGYVRAFSAINLSNDSAEEPLTLDSVELDRSHGIELVYSYTEDPGAALGQTMAPDVTAFTQPWAGKHELSGDLMAPDDQRRLALVLRVTDASIKCPYALGFTIHYTQGKVAQTSTGVDPLYFYVHDTDTNPDKCIDVVRAAQRG